LKEFNIYSREIRSQLEKELRVLSTLNCDSLIDFYGAFYKDASISVILQYMDKGSIDFIIHENIYVTDKAMACITYQVQMNNNLILLIIFTYLFDLHVCMYNHVYHLCMCIDSMGISLFTLW
jgi:serine/threonine protein kinase